MKQTPNLSLNKPEGTDVVNIDDLNANMDVLDAKLGTSGHNHNGTAGQGPKIAYGNITGTPAVVSTTADGLAPKRDGNTTKFLRGDGTWAAPTAAGVGAAAASHVHDDRYFTETEVNNLLANKQPLDATLSKLAALATAANQMIYSTGADAFAMTALSAFARTLLDDADAAAARATLGAAPLTSPALTGVPTAPTAAASTNNTQIATTAFVKTAVNAAVGTRVWVSGEYAIVQNTPTIVEHGISGLNPLYAQGELLLKCMEAEQGYAVGDYAMGWSTQATGNARGNNAALSTTDIRFSTPGTIVVIHKITPSSSSSITMSKWRYVFRIWY